MHWIILGPQFNSFAAKLISWQAGVSQLNWLSVAISSQSSSTVISRDSLNYYSSTGLGSSLYSLGGDLTENAVSIVVAQQYLDCCLRICCRWNMFTEPLLSDESLLWLHYSGFQASCHNILDYVTLWVGNCTVKIKSHLCIVDSKRFWWWWMTKGITGCLDLSIIRYSTED
jgi:hypothetical protein